MEKMQYNKPTEHRHSAGFLEDGSGFFANGFDTEEKEIEATRRIVAAWNYCHGVPTAELESKGADAGFWGRACSRLETKNEKLEAQNAALLEAVEEMRRMLPVVEYLQISRLWETANQGENASLVNYRDRLKEALEATTETYSKAELECKGCMGPCGMCEEGPTEPDPSDLALDYEAQTYGSDAPTEYDPS